MPKFHMPGLPQGPKPPDPAIPFKIFRKFISNSKDALKSAQKGLHDVVDEIKRPFDRY